MVQLHPCKLILNSARQFSNALNADLFPAPISQCLNDGLSSLCYSWELAVWFSTLSRTYLSVLAKSEFQPNLWFSGQYDAPESNVEDCVALKFSRYQAYWLWFCHRRLFSCLSFLNSLRYGVRLFNWKKVAAGKHREIHDAREIICSQHVRNLVLGVNMLDLDFGVHIDSVKQPI